MFWKAVNGERLTQLNFDAHVPLKQKKIKGNLLNGGREIPENRPCVESLQSHFILTMSHWSSGIPICFPSQGTRVQIPWGVLVWNWDSPSLHWWPRRDWSLWPRLRRASSRTITRPSCHQGDNPTWSHTAFLSRFHTRCRSPFQLHNWWSRLLGASPVESLQSLFILTMSDWSSGLPIYFLSQGTWVQIPWGGGGYLCETGILLLALSHSTCKLKFWP
jgi:hypothetical protein